jgi:uncharacterized protein YbjT (DUF2867 family)
MISPTLHRGREMAHPPTSRRIVIVGASGNVGRPTLQALLARKIHTLTIIQRPESTHQYPPEIIVQKGSFNDESFLIKALTGQDVLIIIVPIPNMEIGDLFIHAAAKAGVPYILPTEFGVDAPKVEHEHSMMAPKVARHRLIEELGVSSWIAVIVNFWLDANIKLGLWGIDVKNRKAELMEGADAKVSTTTVARCAEGITVLLSLPESELAKWKNRPFYFSSFELSQQEIFDAVKKASGTTDADWAITERDPAEVIRECEAKIRDGDGFAEWYRLFVMFFQGHPGSNYQAQAVDLEQYGLEKENLSEVVRKAITEV